MRRNRFAQITVMVLAVGVCLLGIPPASHAVIINNITVNNGQVGGNFTGGAAGTTWTFAPINLGPGQSLVLTQNQNHATSSLPTGLPGFNFDTSENAGVAATQYTITINALPGIKDTSTSATTGVLNDSGTDQPDSTTKNEAANWVSLGHFSDPSGGFTLFVGYADTLHSNACLDQGGPAGTAGPACLPWSAGNNIWDGISAGSTAANFFLGGGTNLPGYPVSPHCDVNAGTAAAGYCFDAGALLIVADRPTVPEPSSIFLLGVGLMGAAVYARKYSR